MSNTASPWSSTRRAVRCLLKLGVKVLALLDLLASWIYVLQIFHHHQLAVHLHLGLLYVCVLGMTLAVEQSVKDIKGNVGYFIYYGLFCSLLGYK